MADIFLSYKREDRPLAKQFYATLVDAGFTVWWDDRLNPESGWDAQLDENIKAAKCVLVMWTERSVDPKSFVLNEAHYALDAGKLVPARFDNCILPIAFKRVQYVDMRQWPGETASESWDKLLDWIGQFVAQNERQVEVVTEDEDEFLVEFNHGDLIKSKRSVRFVQRRIVLEVEDLGGVDLVRHHLDGGLICVSGNHWEHFGLDGQRTPRFLENFQINGFHNRMNNGGFDMATDNGFHIQAETAYNMNSGDTFAMKGISKKRREIYSTAQSLPFYLVGTDHFGDDSKTYEIRNILDESMSLRFSSNRRFDANIDIFRMRRVGERFLLSERRGSRWYAIKRKLPLGRSAVQLPAGTKYARRLGRTLPGGNRLLAYSVDNKDIQLLEESAGDLKKRNISFAFPEKNCQKWSISTCGETITLVFLDKEGRNNPKLLIRTWTISTGAFHKGFAFELKQHADRAIKQYGKHELKHSPERLDYIVSISKGVIAIAVAGIVYLLDLYSGEEIHKISQSSWIKTIEFNDVGSSLVILTKKDASLFSVGDDRSVEIPED